MAKGRPEGWGLEGVGLRTFAEPETARQQWDPSQLWGCNGGQPGLPIRPAAITGHRCEARAGMASSIWPKRLDRHQHSCQTWDGVTCGMVTLRLSSHLLSRVGPGQAPTEREIPRSWQATCPLHAAISSVHLRENGWVLWPAPRWDNKGRAQVIPPPCQTALPPHQRLPRSAAAPRSPGAWALVACAQQWPPDTIFKVLITPNCPRSSVKPTQLTGPSRGPQSPSSPEAPGPAPLSHGLTASHSHTCVPTLCLW